MFFTTIIGHIEIYKRLGVWVKRLLALSIFYDKITREKTNLSCFSLKIPAIFDVIITLITNFETFEWL